MRAMTSILLIATACAHAPASRDASAELAGARALFERNIRAIQERDRDAYLDCYRHDEKLVRAGGDGVALGFDELAAGTAPTGHEDWPESLEASDLQLHPVAAGVVYGAYRYVVVIDGERTEGWSERIFIRRNARWWIAVTTAFESPAAKPEETAQPGPPDCGPGMICARVTQGVAQDPASIADCECVPEPKCPPGLFPVFRSSSSGLRATCASSMPPSTPSR